MKKYRVPEGMSDYLPDECYNKNMTEAKILDVFRCHGYERIETPSIEYDNVFSISDDFLIDKAFKMTDTDGSLIILRPDMTMPLARITATRQVSYYPFKVCYLGNSFTLLSDEYRYREFTQAGLELIGVDGYFSDVEVISIAIEALLAAGLDDFLIEVGNIEFIKSVIDESNIDKKNKSELIKNVSKKNNFAIDEIIKNSKTSAHIDNLISLIPTLFGDDAISRAKNLTDNKKSLEILNSVQKTVDLLKKLGYGKYITIDLGLLKSANFYTGTVFKGISRHFGFPILGGGRYNKLFSGPDKQLLPATGFAIGIKNLMTALQDSGNVVKKPGCDYVIGSKKDDEEKAFLIKKNLIKKGYITNYTFISNKEKLEDFKDKIGAKKCIFVDKNTDIENLEN